MRNEDFDRELLVAVTLICTVFAAGASAFETTKPPLAQAATQTPMRAGQLEPVRVVGTPFVLNTNPRERKDGRD
jgi:hypothetical protein